MYCIVSSISDPYFNLAAEEYLFRNAGDDLIFLYSNNPSVVLGKHQNAMAEINPVFVAENQIKVVRRMSGGGAVYHDTGNLNFSFHKTVDDISKVHYGDFSLPVVEVLNSMGVPATMNARNDIIVEGMKVSGHAQHVFRNRVMSHGTLLINSDLDKLSGALKKSKGTYESKAIASVRSKVSNISSFATETISVEPFIEKLVQHVLKTIPGMEVWAFQPNDIAAIHDLSHQKYSTWDWNFGYSPAYVFRNSLKTTLGETLSCTLAVSKGIVTEALIEGDAIPEADSEKLGSALIGVCHSPIEMMTAIRNLNVDGVLLNELLF